MVVDGYVQSLIKTYSKELNMKVNPDNREERLQMALELDKRGKDWEAMELMVGRRIGSSEGQYAFLIMQKKMFPQNSETFYRGFPDVDEGKTNVRRSF